MFLTTAFCFYKLYQSWNYSGCWRQSCLDMDTRNEIQNLLIPIARHGFGNEATADCLRQKNCNCEQVGITAGHRLALQLIVVRRLSMLLIPMTTHGCPEVFFLVTTLPCVRVGQCARLLPSLEVVVVSHALPAESRPFYVFPRRCHGGPNTRPWNADESEC